MFFQNIKNGLILIIALHCMHQLSGQEPIRTTKKLESAYATNQNPETLQNLVEHYFLDSRYKEAEKLIIDFKNTHPDFSSNFRVILLMAKANKFLRDKNDGLLYFLSAKKEVEKSATIIEQLEFIVEFIEYYRKFSEFDFALKEIERGKELINKHKINDSYWLGRFYNRYAAVVNELSMTNEAILLSHKALSYSQKANDSYGLATSFNELGFAHKHTGYHDSTRYYYEKSEKIFNDNEWYRDAMHVTINKILFITHNHYFNHPLEMIEELLEAIAIIDRENLDFKTGDLYGTISSLYTLIPDYKNAYDYRIIQQNIKDQENVMEQERAFKKIKEAFQNDRLNIENKIIQSKAKFEEEKRKDAQVKLKIIITLLVVISILFVVLYSFWIRLKIKNRELLLRNKQKTFLVQEIHHRVKNNLQFVRSILKMQQRLKSINAHEAIEDISRRIDAMSLVHEMLYLDNDAMTVSAKEYFDKLLDLSESMYNHQKTLELKADIQDIHFDLEKLVALGVICSELLANSVKHVFYKVDKPEFTIELKQHDNGYQLKVFDNGNENEKQEQEERTKLGMRLINIFSRQVQGTYTINQEKGYLFVMQFH